VLHTRMMKCALQIDESRAYWSHIDAGAEPSPQEAFERYWFGAKTLPRVKVLIANMRARYSAFPNALWVLHRWPAMEPSTRRLVAHWHVQLSDPLYRSFAAHYLTERRRHPEPFVSRAAVVRWVAGQGPTRWTHASHVQFASKLLSTAHAAGLLGSVKDPRPLTLPRSDLLALEYLLYLLREVRIDGSLTDNPYARSVGIGPADFAGELRRSDNIEVRALGGLTELHFRFLDLRAWAAARLGISQIPGEVSAS
jgi:hypothetical protein